MRNLPQDEYKKRQTSKLNGDSLVGYVKNKNDRVGSLIRDYSASPMELDSQNSVQRYISPGHRNANTYNFLKMDNPISPAKTSIKIFKHIPSTGLLKYDD